MASRSGHLLKQQNHTVSSRWVILLLSRAIKNLARSIPNASTFTQENSRLRNDSIYATNLDLCRVQHCPSGHKGGRVVAKPSLQPSRRVQHTSLYQAKCEPRLRYGRGGHTNVRPTPADAGRRLKYKQTNKQQ